MNNRGFKMKPEELQVWMALRKKCHTHDNENRKAYTRKQKHKNAWAQARPVFAREGRNLQDLIKLHNFAIKILCILTIAFFP